MSAAKICIVIVLVVVYQCTICAQESSGYLLWRFEGITSLHQYDEFMLESKFFYEADKKQGDFVIRICSKEPYLFSYKFADGDIWRIYYRLKTELGVPDNDVFFARGTSCLSKIKGDTPVEVWWVPNKLNFPKTVEIYQPCQIKEHVFKSNKNKQNNSLKYRLLALKKHINKSSNNKLGFVIGTYGVSPSKELLNSLEIAKKILKKEISIGKVLSLIHI